MEGDLVTVWGIQQSGDRQGEVVGVPSGSTLDRGTPIEKRTNDRPEEDGTLNSGGPVSLPQESIRLPRADDVQRNEGVARRGRESDPGFPTNGSTAAVSGVR